MKTKEIAIAGTDHAERALKALRDAGYSTQHRIRDNQTQPLERIGDYIASGGCYLIVVPVGFTPDLSGKPGWIV